MTTTSAWASGSWDVHPDFAAHLAACVDLCEGFRGGTYLGAADVAAPDGGLTVNRP